MLLAAHDESPLGTMITVVDSAAANAVVRMIEFHDRRQIDRATQRLTATLGPIEFGASPLLECVRGQMREYFAGERQAFDFPLDPVGTDFRRRVWDELRRIPYGQTISYGELARRIGDVRATRAVAQANGQNFIAIVIPCHRVIGADGTLTGYGGGLERKRWLLDHEARVAGTISRNLCWDSSAGGHRGVNAARSRQTAFARAAPAEAESLFPA